MQHIILLENDTYDRTQSDLGGAKAHKQNSEKNESTGCGSAQKKKKDFEANRNA